MKFATPVTEEVSINLTPLIDIVFLLLIFFMVSTTFQRETELEIALPEASAQSQSRESVSAVVLEINSQGLYRLGTQSADGISEFISVEFENLGEILEGISGKYATTTLVIKADAKTSHQAVVRALDAAQRAGLKKIKFAAEMTSS
ncbi:MAG: biopolymer transporter ExbD [Arenicellales bacterium]|mgnify:CR=1 FL=1|jgi:biopolymer transport protein ExbD|nr:biopolymer transporter ExbD [Arenicellales bacterium]MDP6791774.1 biopolymer transporter ExbD [Arenicellales bacterium]MDP6918573.1 biopolymer transporter ExbD [Arenicellales bacterium]|tara:strand:- start:1053 stop:1490 length:438 start_codon:yes stop_codon:yes gene_type:complete